MKFTFYPHQLESIENMKMLENTGVVKVHSWVVETSLGFLCDPTGSGKTLSVAGLIKDNAFEWDVSVPHTVRRFTASTDKRNIVSFYKVETYERINSTLVVANPSVVHHWEEELNKLDLKVLKITSKKDIDFTSSLNENGEYYDVVLICSSIYNNIASRCEVEYKSWKRVIFDEPHGKPAVLLPITFGFCWIVSSNITEVYTGIRSGFLHDIFNQFSQDVLSKIIVKNSPETIRNSFKLPTVIKKYYDCYQPILNIVKGLVSENVAQMISAGNIIGAVKELGGETTDNIADLVKTQKLKELENVEDEDKRTRLLLQIEDLNTKFSDALSGPCLICCNNLVNPAMEPSCQNIFCSECILNMVDQNAGFPIPCPICRTQIRDLKSLVFINSAHHQSSPSHQVVLPTKQQQLVNIIKQSADGKFIVYSTWDETFCTIKNVLEQNNISFSEVKGNIPSRIKIIDNFRSGKIKVLFLNSNYSGSGLNLQEATDLIIYHNTSNETIIIGRANRIGRTIPLVCHILV